MLVAISTNRWINGNGRHFIESVGLWKICSTDVCAFHSEIIYSKVLLIFTFLFGLFGSIVAVLAQVYGVEDIKNAIARIMFVSGFLGLCGMIPATVFLVLIMFYRSVSYGLIFGWFGAVLYIVAGFLSWYHHKREPDRSMTLEEIRQQAQGSNTQLPPYTVQPPPSTVFVS
ncbi:hypothetical protein AB205_0002080 [Aquarana catesbeiana]|uniref:Uncharacterized protein n=1 Tax=Aquarana catesbeiana TaxID=8400 RepID=A0A2G9RF80_AQUCT|nr:hypothetical protein AB205_0002080 [Aquarana catesbeiana]